MKAKNKWLLAITLINLAVILYSFYKWEIVDVITPFLLIPLWILLYGSFLAAIAFTIIRIIKYKDWKPFFIQVVAIILMSVIPFNQITLHRDFTMNKAKREEVIKMVEKKAMQQKEPPNSQLITMKLPDKYKNLSKGGGEVLLVKENDKFSVLFFTYRGILDNFSGFIYSPSGEKPKASDYAVTFHDIIKLDDHWYFVSA